MNCAFHLDKPAPARLQCKNCGRFHCDSCVRKVRARTQFIDACAQPNCNGVLREVFIEEPKEETFPVLLKRVFSLEGLGTAAAIALPGWATGIPGLSQFMTAIYCASLVSIYFLIIDHVGRGKPGLPTPSEHLDSWGEIFKVIGRAILCLVVVGLPPGVFLLLRGSGGDQPASSEAVTAVTGFVFLLLSVSYAPAVILSIVITQRTLAAIWPPIWFDMVTLASHASVDSRNTTTIFA